jgi:hypothetical protein
MSRCQITIANFAERLENLSCRERILLLQSNGGEELKIDSRECYVALGRLGCRGLSPF